MEAQNSPSCILKYTAVCPKEVNLFISMCQLYVLNYPVVSLEDVALFFTFMCLELPGCIPRRCSSVLYYVLNYPFVYPEDVALFFTLVCLELPRLCTLKMQRCYLLFCCLLFYFTVLCLGVCLEEELFFTDICLPLPSCVP